MAAICIFMQQLFIYSDTNFYSFEQLLIIVQCRLADLFTLAAAGWLAAAITSLDRAT